MPLDVCQGPTRCLLGTALVNKGDKAGVQALQKPVSVSHFIIPGRISDSFVSVEQKISIFHLFPSKKCREPEYYLCVS